MMVIARCCWFQHDFHKEPAWSAGSAWSFTTSIGSSRDTWCQTRSSAHQDDQSMSKLQKHRNYTIIVLPTPFKMDDSAVKFWVCRKIPQTRRVYHHVPLFRSKTARYTAFSDSPNWCPSLWDRSCSSSPS